MHQRNIPLCTILHMCVPFCYEIVHCVIWDWCILFIYFFWRGDCDSGLSYPNDSQQKHWCQFYYKYNNLKKKWFINFWSAAMITNSFLDYYFTWKYEIKPVFSSSRNYTLKYESYECYGISNNPSLDCLFNSLLRLKRKKTSKLSMACLL